MNSKSQHILVSGASGLIGRGLVPHLEDRGHRVTRLVRRAPESAAEIRWDPIGGTVDWPESAQFDAVIHLAGDNLSSGRWTAARKRSIRESRVRGTATLVDALGRLARPPAVLLSASAIGYYGDRGDEPLEESATPGQGFLAEVCRDWEEAARAASALGTRVVTFRTGVVLSPRGGALARMLPFFRLGLGGRVGSGRQWMSWIGEQDLMAALLALLTDERFRGAVNLVAPGSVTNAEFTATLAAALHRPAFLPVPRWVLRLAFGEMAEATLLASTRVAPGVLQRNGFAFQQPDLAPALAEILDKRSA